MIAAQSLYLALRFMEISNESLELGLRNVV
jgi:hypothetical protein